MRQYRKEVAALPEPLRWKLAHAVVEPGFSQLQVYLALGHPWQIESTGENQEIWLYIARPLALVDPQGSTLTGWKTNADFIWGGLEPLGELSVTLTNGQVRLLSYCPPTEKR